MAEYRLHGFAESGNAYKAALMLELCGADWEVVIADTFSGETRDPAWRASRNVMGEVPVLEVDGRFYSQSGVILDLLAERFGKFGWTNDEERREIYRWILFDNSKFTSFIALNRAATLFMPAPDLAAAIAGRIPEMLGRVEAYMASREWVALDRATVADLSMAGYVFFDGEIAVDWSAFSALSAWRERVRALPGWKAPYDLLPRIRAAAPAAS